MALDKRSSRRKLSGKEGGAGGTPPALSEAQLRAVRTEIYATYSDWRINAIVAHLASLVALLERSESRQLQRELPGEPGQASVKRDKPNVPLTPPKLSQLELYPPGDDEAALQQATYLGDARKGAECDATADPDAQLDAAVKALVG